MKLLFSATVLLSACLVTKADISLNGIGNALNSAVNSTKGALQNATTSIGSSVTSAANSTNSTLQSATNSVAGGLNTTVNATQNAAQSVANDGGALAADVINSTGLSAQVGGPVASLVEKIAQNGVRHPLIFWPGYGTSRLRVEVEQQDIEPDCPSSGAFHVAFGNPTVLEGWPERCIYKFLEINYDPNKDDFNSRFSSPPNVSVSVADFGSKLCAPIPYEPMFLFFEAVGYSEGHDFFVACYDWRVSPFQDVTTDEPHLERTRTLVEEAYNNTGRPVYLAGHSNGGLMALALLNTTSAEWRAKYIAGFIGFAGNWAGQGSTYAPLISGQSLFDNEWFAQMAPAYETWPGAYMSMADPGIYNSSEVVLQTTLNGQKKNYTTADSQLLFRDANLTLAEELGQELIGNFSSRTAFPGTHFYGFYGSGQQTVVGVTLPDLEQGTKPDSNGNIYAEGDSNQEATDNLSPVRFWNQSQSSCFHFEMIEEKGVSHLTLPINPSVLYKSVDILFKTPQNCLQQDSVASTG